MDWYDFLGADEKAALRESFDAGPQDLDEIAPGQWGMHGASVICLGDVHHMRKVAAKMFNDKFHRRPDQMWAHATEQLKDYRTVAERLLDDTRG